MACTSGMHVHRTNTESAAALHECIHASLPLRQADLTAVQSLNGAMTRPRISGSSIMHLVQTRKAWALQLTWRYQGCCCIWGMVKRFSGSATSMRRRRSLQASDTGTRDGNSYSTCAQQQ